MTCGVWCPGTIPTELGQLTALERGLVLFSNKLTSSIPTQVAICTYMCVFVSVYELCGVRLGACVFQFVCCLAFCSTGCMLVYNKYTCLMLMRLCASTCEGVALMHTELTCVRVCVFAAGDAHGAVAELTPQRQQPLWYEYPHSPLLLTAPRCTWRSYKLTSASECV